MLHSGLASKGRSITSNSDLCWLDAGTLASLIKDREVSPVEVVDSHLDRIVELNGELVAFVHVDADGARAQARTAESEIARSAYRGPLHGLPVAYKDIYDVQGLPTTAASRVMKDYVARHDSTVAARLRQAGAICLGKLNTYEFASGSLEVFGETRNPWDMRMSTGGSSAGSGAALAARIVPLATGSDTGGSIRIPASFCGLVGLRPTHGLVSRAGVIPLSWSLDSAGPMARTVGDAALMLGAIAGRDERDQTTVDVSVPDYRAGLVGDLAGMRIGVPTTYFFDDVEDEIGGGVRAALEVLRGLGATIRDIELPHARFGLAASWAIAYCEAFAFHRDNFYSRPRDYTPAFLHKITGAACLTTEEYLLAQRIRQIITAEFQAVLGQVDAIVTPTTPFPAFQVGTSTPQDQGRMTRPVSLTGLPALAVPCGFTHGGLPISMQVIGRAWDEATVLCIGHAYEQATEWHLRRPPLTPGTSPLEAQGQPPARASPHDSRWVLDFARAAGLSFVAEEDAVPIAASIGPIKLQLAAARKQVASSAEPSVRPAPG